MRRSGSEKKEGECERGTVLGNIPPPTMQTSTWSLSRSMVAGSKDSSGVAIHRRVVVENSLLVCGILAVAGHDCGIVLLLESVVDSVFNIEHCDLARGLAVCTRRPDILAGVDMALSCWQPACNVGKWL